MNDEVPVLPDPLEAKFRSMWGIQHMLAADPARSTESIEAFLEAQRVQAVLIKYTYFYDGGDLDNLMTVFHPDCRLVNPRGTYVGAAAIRDNYEYLMTQPFVRFHYVTNVLAQVDEDGVGAWLTAFLYCISGGNASWTGFSGTYTARLIKNDGEWQYQHLRISGNVQTENGELNSAMPKPPVPTLPTTSADWLGPGWVR